MWKHVEEERGRDLFLVGMGAHVAAEVCELVGTFSLEKISEICNKSKMGLYRDDCLLIFRKKSGSQLEKKNQILFKEYDFKITEKSNQKL